MSARLPPFSITLINKYDTISVSFVKQLKFENPEGMMRWLTVTTLRLTMMHGLRRNDVEVNVRARFLLSTQNEKNGISRRLMCTTITSSRYIYACTYKKHGCKMSIKLYLDDDVMRNQKIFHSTLFTYLCPQFLSYLNLT